MRDRMENKLPLINTFRRMVTAAFVMYMFMRFFYSFFSAVRLLIGCLLTACGQTGTKRKDHKEFEQDSFHNDSSPQFVNRVE